MGGTVLVGRRSAVLAIWMAAAGASLCGQAEIETRRKPPAEPAAPRSYLRADSNLVLVPVVVVDRQNHPVTGLEKENFRVFDDGVERTISFFAMEDEPLTVGVVFDHSGSIGGGMGLEGGVVHWFLRTSNPQDEYFLVLFASRPVLQIPLTPSSEEIQSRILDTVPTGSTALLDAVVLGLREVQKSSLSRKALLVVSDGGENNSRYTKSELQKILAESDALLYAVGIDTFQANFPLLRWMAELSGGRAFPAAPRDLPDITSKIGTELRNRYVLGFSYGEMPRDGRHRSLRVQIVPPRGLPPLRVFWRRGYYAPLD